MEGMPDDIQLLPPDKVNEVIMRLSFQLLAEINCQKTPFNPKQELNLFNSFKKLTNYFINRNVNLIHILDKLC